MPVEQVQQALRSMFTRWGCPDALRVDNGPPWGNKQELPSPLCLWLHGLAIDVLHNRPYHPQDNGKVERSHGWLNPSLEPEQCANLESLQTQLEQAATLQRTAYPSCPGKRTRLQAYPALAHRARPYTPEQEGQLWQFPQVLQRLAHHPWTRTVSSTGQLSLYNRNYSVGRAYAGQRVTVSLDPHTQTWVIEAMHGTVIRQLDIRGFDAQSVRTLQMTYRKPCRRKSPPEGA